MHPNLSLGRRLSAALLSAAAVALLVFVPATPASSGSTAAVSLPTGVRVSVPVSGGRVSANVSRPGLFIPAGFPISEFPKTAAEYPRLTGTTTTPAGTVLDATYGADPGHFSTWRWGGSVSTTPVRALIVIDRSDANERPAVADWVYAWQNFVRQRLMNLGLSDAKVPYISYVQDTGALGQCPQPYGTWTYVNYSFTTACTSFNILTNCSTTNPSLIGCAWMPSPPYHAGTSAQPSIWIKAGLPSYTTIRNDAHHELFHTLGFPHNTSDPCSLMWNDLGACGGATGDKNLSADDDAHLANTYNHNPD